MTDKNNSNLPQDIHSKPIEEQVAAYQKQLDELAVELNA
jgi:hypothetical protein